MNNFIGGFILGWFILFLLYVLVDPRTLPKEFVVKEISKEYITSEPPMYYLPYDKKYAIGDTIRFY